MNRAAILGLTLLIATTPALAQQAPDDKPIRGLVQQLSQAQQMILGIPDLLAEVQRLQAENKDLKAKLDAKGEK